MSGCWGLWMPFHVSFSVDRKDRSDGYPARKPSGYVCLGNCAVWGLAPYYYESKCQLESSSLAVCGLC
jgi:hypothetical protein